MFPSNVRAIPALLTDLVLENYAAHLAAQRLLPEELTDTTTSVATCLEETLAPLLLIHGKVFTSAVGIALHGAEVIIRYVACDTFDENTKEETSQAEKENSRQKQQQQSIKPDCISASNRCLYFVGEHRLFSPFYCPCGAYGFQSIRRQEAWLCKHMLALRMALILEKRGLVKDAIRERQVSRYQLQEMMQRLD